MREQLDALVTELRRLRRDGVSRVSVSEESLSALKSLVASVKTGDTPADSAPVAQAPAKNTPAPEIVREAPAPVFARPVEKVVIPVVEKTILEYPPVAVKPAEPKGPVVPKAPAPPVITLPAGDATVRLAALREKLLADPVAVARVAPGKKLAVFDGAADAPVLFLIHMPGSDDGLEGRVLAGAEGELYGKIVGAMGLPRAKIQTASLLPYRPEIPGGYDHREPTPDEVAYFLPYLRALIETVKPRVIITLGGGAQDALFGKSETISKSRGNWREYEGIPVMPTYHISYLIRNNTNKSKRIVWEDMLSVMERLALPISEKQRGYFK
jgi:uracil-DNA glycosylase family 4